MMEILVVLGLLSIVLFAPTSPEIRRRELQYGFGVLTPEAVARPR
ncbi:hypothetical protein [Symbiobacterium thermophilum]|nr:hypothetical protein [Symbiobacterium thermophilum]